MGLFNLFRRKREDETARRTRLLSTGRILEGTIVDAISDPSGSIQIFFNYRANGIAYESSQTLNDDQQSRKASYAPGARIVVRYNPRQPADAVVV
jgi:hypothetical protein